MNWAQKAISTIHDWLVVGPSPKFQDPQNAAQRLSGNAGVPVNDTAALSISTFFACLRIVASTIAALPLPVYRRGRDGIAVEARDVGLWRVLHDSPNADQTSIDYWEFALISMLMRGDHFARKLREGSRLIGLEPVRPDIVTVKRSETGARRYRWSWQGQSYDLDETDVFHVPSFGGGPLGGLSIMGHAKHSLGIALAADNAAGSMFGNGAQPSGALTFKEFLKPDQRKIAREDLTTLYVGSHNAGVPMILEGGATWQQISMKADEAQLLQSRAWSVEEVCRWFGVPPVLIGHNEKTTSWGSGVEQILQGFVKFTLMPYLRRIELAIAKQLLSPQERVNGLFAEFKLEGLLRGSSKERAAFYHYGLSDGWLKRNEVRRLENMPPVEGGDVITVQSQNIALEEAVRIAVEEAVRSALRPETR